MIATLRIAALLLLVAACDAEDPPCGVEGAPCCSSCTLDASPICQPMLSCETGLECRPTINVETGERTFACFAEEE